MYMERDSGCGIRWFSAGMRGNGGVTREKASGGIWYAGTARGRSEGLRMSEQRGLRSEGPRGDTAGQGEGRRKLDEIRDQRVSAFSAVLRKSAAPPTVTPSAGMDYRAAFLKMKNVIPATVSEWTIR